MTMNTVEYVYSQFSARFERCVFSGFSVMEIYLLTCAAHMYCFSHYTDQVVNKGASCGICRCLRYFDISNSGLLLPCYPLLGEHPFLG